MIAHLGNRGRLCLFVLAALFTLPLWADDVAVGDSVDQVIERLGKPQGQLSFGGKQVFAYDRGLITLEDGKVVSFNLVSAEAARKKKAASMQRHADRLDAKEAQRAARVEAGLAEKQQTLENTDFTNRSSRAQLEYWEGFEKRYPEVPVRDRISSLRTMISNEARQKQIADQKALAAQIRELEASIDALANRTGVGRSKYRQGNRDLKRMRAELEALRQKQAGSTR